MQIKQLQEQSVSSSEMSFMKEQILLYQKRLADKET